jgi:hypothetical protein
MTAYKQPSACATCGGPVPVPGGACTECTAITLSAGGAGGRTRGAEHEASWPGDAAKAQRARGAEHEASWPGDAAKAQRAPGAGLPSSRSSTTPSGVSRWRAGAMERPSLQPGDVLEGKWRLEEVLGAGGMGQVFRARDLALDRSVAIKLLHAALCEDPESVARFEREARAMARLEHAHITPIHAVGQEGGRPFIVMKHLEGMSLARYLRSLPGPLPVPEVLALARQLCAGLAFIHQRGCVHRDIKPGNIFLSPSGHATLLDFGILWEHRGAESTGSGVRLGTPSYMAPEQARGEPVDSRADLYSLGLVLLEASTGLPPASTCRMLGEGPQAAVLALQEQAPWLPAPLAAVLVRAAALNPQQRHGDALALLADMEKAAPTVAPPSAGIVTEETLTPLPVSRGKRTRRVALASLVGAGTVVVGLGLFISGSTKDARTSGATGPVAPAQAMTALAGSALVLAPPAAATPDPASARATTSELVPAPPASAAPEAASTRVMTERTGSEPGLVPTASAARDEASTRAMTDHAGSERVPAAPGSAAPGQATKVSATATPAMREQDRVAAVASPASVPPPRPVAAAPGVPAMRQQDKVASVTPPSSGAPARIKPSSLRGSSSRGGSRPERSGTSHPQPTTPPVAASASSRGELRVVTVHAGKAVWANVSVDGKHHGATPVSLDLPEGRHSIRVERDGFSSQQRSVDVSPGSRAVVRIELHE